MKGFMNKALASILSLGMVITSMPLSVKAKTVTTNPGESELQVEYFNTTFYNWNEDLANSETKKLDAITEVVEGGYTDQGTNNGITWANLSALSTSSGVEVETPYYVYVIADQAYYKTYFTQSGTTYTLTYKKNGSVITIASYTGTAPGSNWAAEEVSTRKYNHVAKSDGSYYMTIALYTYTENGEVETGEYLNTGYYFTDASNNPKTTPFSTWVNPDQNWHIYTGIAAEDLSTATNAPFSNNVVAANLFATDGSNSTYASVYTNCKVPYIYDEETGYYTLDSDSNAVYFDGTIESEATLAIADKPVSFSVDGDTSHVFTGFQPFVEPSTTIVRAHKGSTTTFIDLTNTERDSEVVDTYNLSNNAVYGFGMITSVDFQMTDTGTDKNGNDVVFEFSGDDDVWVYVDGKLVLDIGGTHDAINGKINFASGEVTLGTSVISYKDGTTINSSTPQGIGDKSTHCSADGTSLENCDTNDKTTLTQTNMYEKLGTTLTEFSSQGNHTLTIYYMDRGRTKTNCLIRFNLPQKDSLSVTNLINEYYSNAPTVKIDEETMNTLNNIDFSFTLYKNEEGEVETVANRAYTIYDVDGKIVGSGTTSATGKFTLKNGQTAVFKNITLDDPVSYYAIEDVPGESWSGNWSATTNVVDSTITDPNGFTSNIVSVEGSYTTTDTISFVRINEIEYVTHLSLSLQPETIVLDYGLPVDVNILANDFVTGGQITGVEILEGEHLGNVEVNNGIVTYTPVEELNDIDVVTYRVTATDPTGGNTVAKDSTLTIIPATSVYYEESYGTLTYSNGSAKWNNVGTPLGTKQETGLVGTANDSTYGTDVLYLNDLQDSYNTSKSVDTTNYAAMYRYNFTGTGTAIYGRISTASGYIRVQVKEETENGWTIVDNQYIDTVVLGSVNNETTLYNIPVYSNEGFDFGRYQVTVTVYKKGTITSTGSSGNEFYFDGYRAYNPVFGDEIAEAAYAIDGEANNAVINIRAKVVADENESPLDTNNIFTLTDIEGQIQDVDTYNQIGPNEELYLVGDNYKVTFDLLAWDAKDYKIYIGMKAPGSSSSSVTIGGNTININNSMDCYYDISKYVSVKTENEITYGEVEIKGNSGLVALTYIKVVGAEEFNLGYAQDIEQDGFESEAAILYMVSPVYLSMLMNIEEEVEVFRPATIDIAMKYQAKLKKATITINTSKDVAYIVVDGKKLKAMKSLKGYKFTYTAKKVQIGTTFEVIAYDANGLASEAYTIAAI